MDSKVLFLLFMLMVESHGETIDVIDYRQQSLDQLLQDRDTEAFTAQGINGRQFEKLFVHIASIS